MRRLVALLWIGLLLGALAVVPKEAKAEDTNWWVKSVQLANARAVAVAPNGDIIVAGSTYEFGAGYDDVWILRLDESGNVKWQKTYGGSDDDGAFAVTIAPNGDIIVVGYTESFGAGYKDVWVLRLDENGKMKWQKTYGGISYDEANAVALAKNGDIIVAGYTINFDAVNGDIWILRLDESGNVKWQKTFGGKGYDGYDGWNGVVNVVDAPDGDIIVAGYTESFSDCCSDGWVFRLDSNGNVKWQKTYGGSSWDRVNAVVVAPNGDVIVVGNTQSFGTGSQDVWVLRLDENGNVKWQKLYDKFYVSWATSVAVAPNGDIIVNGNHFLLRLSPDGEPKWAVKFKGGDIKLLSDGTAVLTEVNDYNSFHVVRFNIDQVPQYSGWLWDEKLSPQVQDTDAHVEDTNAEIKTTNAVIQTTNAEVHEAKAELRTIWTYTPPKATLEISSEPSGAEVYINEDYKGKTPLTLELEPGTYDVKLTMEEYTDYATTVTLEAGETKELNIKLEPSLQDIKTQVPTVVVTPLQWGAFPIVIENPTDSEIEVPITVKSESFEVKISQDLENPFQQMPSGREDKATIKLNPNEKKILAVVFGENELSKRKDNLVVQIGDKSWSIRSEINSRTASGNFFAEYTKVTIYEHPQDLIKNKGFITFEGKETKILPVERFIVMTNYDPRIHGWGFSNDESAKSYNPLSKSGLTNIIYAQEGIFGIDPQLFILPLSVGMSTYKAQQGLCYGMVYTSGLYYEGMIDISPHPGDVKYPNDMITYKGKTMTAGDVVAAYFATQYTELWLDFFGNILGSDISDYYGKLEEKNQREAFESLKKCLSSGYVCDVSVKLPPLNMHEVLAYALVELHNDKYGALVYDPNYPKETRIIYLDPYSTDKAKYSASEKIEATVVRIRPILSSDPTEILIKAFGYDKDKILLYFDPVETYTIKTSDGNILSKEEYISIKGKDYEVVVLPKDRYTIEITGNNYVILGSVLSSEGVSIYNITAKGENSVDTLVVGTKKFEYHTGSSKEVSIEVTYSKDDLSEVNSVNAELTLNENQAVMISDPQQVASGILKVEIDTNGDGVFDNVKTYTNINKENSPETTITSSTVPTKTKSKGGICGPALVVAFALIPLLRRHR